MKKALDYNNGLIIVLKKIKSRWDHKTTTQQQIPEREREIKKKREREKRDKAILIRDNYSQPMTY